MQKCTEHRYILSGNPSEFVHSPCLTVAVSPAGGQSKRKPCGGETQRLSRGVSAPHADGECMGSEGKTLQDGSPEFRTTRTLLHQSTKTVQASLHAFFASALVRGPLSPPRAVPMASLSHEAVGEHIWHVSSAPSASLSPDGCPRKRRPRPLEIRQKTRSPTCAGLAEPSCFAGEACPRRPRWVCQPCTRARASQLESTNRVLRYMWRVLAL